VTVESASLSEGGYVVLYLDDRDGPVVGQSAYLGPGTHRNVEIQVDRELPDGHTLVAVAYQDSDGDRALTRRWYRCRPAVTRPPDRATSSGFRRKSAGKGHRRVRNGLLYRWLTNHSPMTIRHNDLAVDWLGYATLRIEGDDSVVYMDPGRYGASCPASGSPTPRVSDTRRPRTTRRRTATSSASRTFTTTTRKGIRRVAATTQRWSSSGINVHDSDRDLDRPAELDYDVVTVSMEDELLANDVPDLDGSGVQRPRGPERER